MAAPFTPRPSANSDRLPDLPKGVDPRLAGDHFLLEAALKDYEAAWSREEKNIAEAYADLKFLAGGENQWDSADVALRKEEGRPCLTVNKLGQFCRQITGDIRQMRPAIKVVGVDDQSDSDTADKLSGLVRYIENRSVAKAAYYSGADSQVRAGMGHWRVLTEYAGDSTFDQEIKIAPIEDGVSVLWDPDAVDQTRTDGRFCFVPVDMSRSAFDAKYPGMQSSGMPGDDIHRCFANWYSEDYQRVCEYWFKSPIVRTLLLNDEGRVVDLTDKSAEEIEQAQAVVEYGQRQGMNVRIEKRPGTQVYRALITNDAVLEQPKKWPGRYIPIIRVQGEQILLGREIMRHGALRFARDPQRLYNYLISQQVEVVALQPKAPFLGTKKNFENFESEWEQANSASLPYLTYTPDTLNGGQAPQRAQPPVASQGIENLLIHAEADLKSTIGIYDAGLGNKSNETSGVAITARQREGDTGTYVYIENFGQAIAHTGAVIVDLIPHIYDTQRTIRIMGEDGKLDKVTINRVTGQDANGRDMVENDVTVGAYDVVAQMGPSYTTRRDEQREQLNELMKALPDVAPALLDVWVSSQDMPNKDEIAERLELLMPENVRAFLQKKRGLQPEPPPPLSEKERVMEAIEMGEIKLKSEEQQVRAVEAQTKREIALIALRKAEAEAGALAAPAGPTGEDPAAVLKQAIIEAEAERAIRKLDAQERLDTLEMGLAEKRIALTEGELALAQFKQDNEMIALEAERLKLERALVEAMAAAGEQDNEPDPDGVAPDPKEPAKPKPDKPAKAAIAAIEIAAA